MLKYIVLLSMILLGSLSIIGYSKTIKCNNIVAEVIGSEDLNILNITCYNNYLKIWVKISGKCPNNVMVKVDDIPLKLSINNKYYKNGCISVIDTSGIALLKLEEGVNYKIIILNKTIITVQARSINTTNTTITHTYKNNLTTLQTILLPSEGEERGKYTIHLGKGLFLLKGLLIISLVVATALMAVKEYGRY